MLERHILLHEVQIVLSFGKVIVDYPTDTPYPSRLICHIGAMRPLHVVSATDPISGHELVITVYEPDPARWIAPDFEERYK
jgi:hypothetical protein